MALTGDRNTASKDIVRSVSYPVKANVIIYDGSLVALSAGFAVPAADAAGAVVVGVADWRADNTGGADGAKVVRVRRGVFLLGNAAGGAAVTRADIGKSVFVSDDGSVTRTDPTNHTVAGEALELESGGVWVKVSP
jgi:hypothetical protein